MVVVKGGQRCGGGKGRQAGRQKQQQKKYEDF